MTICSVEGCDKPNYQHSYCKLHYWRWYRNGHTDLIPRFKRSSCSVEGCTGKGPFRHGLCNIHAQRKRNRGEIGPVERLRREFGMGGFENGYHVTMKNGIKERGHVAVAEAALGKKLPPKAVVHHVDKNRSNNKPTNLVVCPDSSYHKLIHQRDDAYNACGNANWFKCWLCKTYDDPANMSKHTNRNQFVHLKCAAKYAFDRRMARA
jgi:hypothetical protein